MMKPLKLGCVLSIMILSTAATRSKPRSKLPEVIKFGQVYTPMAFEFSTDENGEHHNLTGVMGEMMKDLAQYMKFKYRIILPPDRTYGTRDENGQWSGIIGMVQRGEMDFAVGLWDQSHRREAVDFSQSFHINKFTFIVRKSTRLSINDAFLKIFSRDVWIGILLSKLFVASLVTWLLKPNVNFMKVLVDLFGAVINHQSNLKLLSWKIRFVIGAWLLSGFVIGFVFAGAILSTLAVRKTPEAIKTFKELKDGVDKGTHKCYVGRNDHFLFEILKRSGGIYSQLANAILKNDWFYHDFPELVSKMEENTAVIHDNDLLKVLVSTSAPDVFEISSDPLSMSLLGLAIRKDFCCKEELDEALENCRSAHLFDQYTTWTNIKLRIKTRNSKHFKDQIEEPYHRIELVDVKGLFKILLFGYSTSFLVLCGEIIHAFFMKRKTSTVSFFVQ